MKCIRIKGNNATVRRLSEEEAAALVAGRGDWEYCPKSVWRRLRQERSTGKESTHE